MTGPSATREVVVRFPTHPHSVRTVRQLVTDTLRSWGLELLVDDARLVVTELSTNATLHSGARSFLLSVTTTPAAGVRSPWVTRERCRRPPSSAGPGSAAVLPVNRRPRLAAAS
jgi:hypothetical protein